jgi:hypothetical protein
LFKKNSGLLRKKSAAGLDFFLAIVQYSKDDIQREAFMGKQIFSTTHRARKKRPFVSAFVDLIDVVFDFL